MTSTLVASQNNNLAPNLLARRPKARVIRLVIEAYLLIADKIISTNKKKGVLIDMKKISNDLKVLILSDSNDIASLEESLKSDISKQYANAGLGSLISRLAPNLPYEICEQSDNKYAFNVAQARDRLYLVRYYISSNISDYSTMCRVTQSAHCENIQKLCSLS